MCYMHDIINNLITNLPVIGNNYTISDCYMGIITSWIEASITGEQDLFYSLCKKLESYNDDLPNLQHYINYIKNKSKHNKLLNENEIEIFQMLAFLERISIYSDLRFSYEHSTAVRENGLLLDGVENQPIMRSQIVQSDKMRSLGGLELIYTHTNIEFTKDSLTELLNSMVDQIHKDEWSTEVFGFMIYSGLFFIDGYVYNPSEKAWQSININQKKLRSDSIQSGFLDVEEIVFDLLNNFLKPDENKIVLPCDIEAIEFEGSVNLIVAGNMQNKTRLTANLHNMRINQLKNTPLDTETLPQEFCNALYQRDMLLVRKLLPLVDINMLVENDSILATAIMQGFDIDIIKLILKRDPKLNLGELTPLAGAIQQQNLRVVQLLLSRGVNVNKSSLMRYEENLLPLEIGMYIANLSIIRCLLPHVTKSNLSFYLHKAVEHANEQVISTIFNYMLANNLPIDYTQLLIVACKRDTSKTFEYLLSLHSDFEQHIYNEKLLIEIVKYDDQLDWFDSILFSIRDNRKLNDALKSKILYQAIKYNNLMIVYTCIRLGVNLNISAYRWCNNKLPLEFALDILGELREIPPNAIDILKVLMNSGAGLRGLYNVGMIAMQGQIHCMNYDLSLINTYKLLRISVHEGFMNDVRFLLEQCDLEIEPADFKYIILLAVKQSYSDIFKFLVSRAIVLDGFDLHQLIFEIGELQNLDALKILIEVFNVPLYKNSLPTVITPDTQIQSYIDTLEQESFNLMRELVLNGDCGSALKYLELNEQFMFLERKLITVEEFQRMQQQAYVPSSLNELDGPSLIDVNLENSLCSEDLLDLLDSNYIDTSTIRNSQISQNTDVFFAAQQTVDENDNLTERRLPPSGTENPSKRTRH